MPILCDYTSKCASTPGAATSLPIGTVLMWSLPTLPGGNGKLGNETWDWYGDAEGRLILADKAKPAQSNSAQTIPDLNHASTAETKLTADHIPTAFAPWDGTQTTAPLQDVPVLGPYSKGYTGGGKGHTHPLPVHRINLIVRTA